MHRELVGPRGWLVVVVAVVWLACCSETKAEPVCRRLVDNSRVECAVETSVRSVP